MDENGFMNTGISPWGELNRGADESFFKSNHYQFSYLESPLPSNEALALRELIGRLSGGIGTPTAFLSADSSNFASPTADCSSLASSKLNLAIMDPVSITNLESSDALTPALSSLTADPDFVERAAKFSRFESRSFNCKSPPPSGLSSTGEMDFKFSSNPVVAGNVKLSRVLNSPALKQGGSARRNVDQGEIPMYKKMGSNANSSIEVSSTSERIASGETGSKISKGMSSRKRKAASRGKTKDESNSAMVVESGENENGKRPKLAEGGIMEATIEEETKVGEKPSANQKPFESPKDYIHVRARRGQATDSHSLAERVRREKISERMKLLQDLVPGCNKVTGKALMLDEIINYVQSLQRQVEFLSMKLSSLNPDLDSNMKNLLSKDMFQQDAMTVPQQMYSLNSSSPSFHHQNLPQLHYNHCNSTNISTAPLNQCPMDSLSMDACNLEIHFPSVNGFNQTLPQFPSLVSEDELHNIVQMGFVSKPVPFAVSNPLPDMKLES